MTWWALTQGLPVATYNSLTVRAFTNNPDHLFMSWAYHKPARHLLYRTVRGATVLCGYKYIWDTPFIAEQTQPGDTTYHTFSLTDLTHESTIWYYLWAPDGPYGLEIQGPLMHFTLPTPPFWPRKLTVATQAKGVFFTRNFTGPPGFQPYWIAANNGLHSLKVYQLCQELLAPDARMFAIVGEPESRIVYRLEPPDIPWWHPFTPDYFPDWEPVLTTEAACELTGSASGKICWITTNFNFPGDAYVLFNSSLTTNGTWCIRSRTYGRTWEAFQIFAGLFNYTAGNIIAGISQGTSIYAPGHVLYAALCTSTLWPARIYFSFDWGETWAPRDAKGISIQTPRCLVDPTDQSIVYIGGAGMPPQVHELYRSLQHGLNLVEVDGNFHLGLAIAPYVIPMWIHHTEYNWATVLQGDHIFTTTNFCATWLDHGPMQMRAARLHILSHSPQYLYLARHVSASPPTPPTGPHVIFISDNNGVTLWGRAGNHCHLPDGGRDSIPYDCGGVSFEGMLHTNPREWEWTA